MSGMPFRLRCRASEVIYRLAALIEPEHRTSSRYDDQGRLVFFPVPVGAPVNEPRCPDCRIGPHPGEFECYYCREAAERSATEAAIAEGAYEAGYDRAIRTLQSGGEW